MESKKDLGEIQLFINVGDEGMPFGKKDLPKRMAKITYIHALNSVKMFDDGNDVELEFPNEDTITISKTFIKRLADMMDKLPKKED